MSLPKLFKWNSQTSPEEYLDALNSPHYRSKIGNFTSAIFPENREGIEQANKILTDIICGTAKVSLPTKGIKKYKTHKPKKWFNKDCQKARKLLKQAANKANMLPSEPCQTKEKTVKLKEFKKICKIQQKKFWDNRIYELNENRNNKFWNIWKKCNENIAIKNTESVDGEKWEKYYSNLFSNNSSGNGIEVNSKTNATQKKISNEHLIIINKLTNCAELKKILNY